MGTSELVANALLHAQPPYSVQVRGTLTHPRIEIADGSPTPPSVRQRQPRTALESLDRGPSDGEQPADDLLDTYGRGLSMVAMASVHWGASLESDSKVVWFEPAAHIDEQGGPEPMFLEAAPPSECQAPGARTVEIRLLGVDPFLYAAQRRHHQTLRRELRLLALSHQNSYPLAEELARMFTIFEDHFPASAFRESHRLAGAHAHLVDLIVPMSDQATDPCVAMVEAFEQADDFCRIQRLPSLARSTTIRNFQTWLLEQVIDQLDGAAPQPWTPAAADPPA